MRDYMAHGAYSAWMTADGVNPAIWNLRKPLLDIPSQGTSRLLKTPAFLTAGVRQLDFPPFQWL